MLSALCWVRKGASAVMPSRAKLSDEEFERIQKEMGVQLEDARQELDEEMGIEKNHTEVVKVDDELAIYNLDDYDNEEKQSAAPMFSNIKGLAYYDHDEEDPYIKLKDGVDEDEDEELKIEATDNLLLACKTEDDVSYLEVYVYEESEDNIYVHHDILLPSFPLCLEWLDFSKSSSTKGNFVAIGTFDPQVEIWDLDTVDSMFPSIILGQIPAANQALKSTKEKHGPARVAKRPQKERHVDAVMAISANKHQNNLIATGSADTTVKLWDMNRPTSAVSSYDHHTNKVQAVVWNPVEASVLLTGGYDKKAFAFDSRAPDSLSEWSLTADVECMKWDPFRSEVSTEDGIVKAFDVRTSNKKPLFTLHAHDSAVSALDLNPHIPGCLVTGAGDKTVKIWCIEGDKPKCLVSRDLDAGNIFSTVFSADSPYVMAVGGSKGKVVIWNLEDNSAFKRGFPSLQFSSTGSKEESNRAEIVAMASDEEAPTDDEEEQTDEEMEGDYSEEEVEDHV